MPKVYNVKDKNIPKGSVYIGRGTTAGNPFIIGIHGDRNTVIDRYEKEVLPFLDLSEYKGKNLICHCKPHRCHGDSILAYLDKDAFDV